MHVLTALAPIALFTGTSKSNDDLTAQQSTILGTSKLTGGSKHSPAGNSLCSLNNPCTGDLTYFDTATDSSSPGACGTTNDGEVDLVLALPHGIMDASYCGKTVRIEFSGKTEFGKVVDKCMGCTDQSIDLSRALFQKFSELEAGRLSGAH
ncbi:uncharacterized protein N7498_001648 [Penicillium cinerascens]|uniref:RlpA-like protein double-psi beta-barrel domain-containing protein n=1 Tax=Penicillium cinerascens TaxID=70096 RepID=A0A9W9TAC9_9EURO|nr:uncharacterized protein N7498_001648 [Penicillium cinerascens]KAJ5215241.1 hypothetical protein N7498_001648 [Penicillium cinerascens]